MIDLLPPEQKEILILEKKERMIMILGIVFLSFFVSSILVLLSVNFLVAGQAQAQEIILKQKQKEFQDAKIRILESKIIFANEDLSKVASFYQERISLLEVFEETCKLFPRDTYLKSFSYKDRKISLSAFAYTRSSLLEFRQNLIGKREFKNISFPGEPWIKAADIDFTVMFEIK